MRIYVGDIVVYSVEYVSQKQDHKEIKDFSVFGEKLPDAQKAQR